MDFVTAANTLIQQLATVCSEHDPLVRAALLVAARPWHEADHDAASRFQWGEFATEMLAVEAHWWQSPAPHIVVCAAPQVATILDSTIAALAESIATVFDRVAVEIGETAVPRYAEAAAQIRDAATRLMQPGSGAADS